MEMFNVKTLRELLSHYPDDATVDIILPGGNTVSWVAWTPTPWGGIALTADDTRDNHPVDAFMDAFEALLEEYTDNLDAIPAELRARGAMYAKYGKEGVYGIAANIIETAKKNHII